MKSWKRLAIGALLLGIATATIVPFARRGARSVRLVTEPPRSASTRFDRMQSAALFVGVRRFTSGSVEEVPYAADDAVDLAYVFALERRVRLVPPRRVVLALSGDPVKPKSRERLRALREAGADVRAADAASIRSALREQTALAGRDGILILTVATHGFLHDGTDYILGASSAVREPATMIANTDMFEAIASSAAQRSLVLVDSCRERMVTGRRSVLPDTMSAAPLARRMGHTRGQAVFYAAAAGQWAYDDREARNGVFTKAVIDGIHCGAAKVRDAVTAEKLAGYVERNVLAWIRANRDPNVGSATQVSMDGEARNMPLAQCGAAAPSSGPARVTTSGTTIRAFSDENKPLWLRNADGVVTHAEAVDLDADGSREVVFATRDAVTTLDATGNPLWSAREAMKVTALVTFEGFRQHTNDVVTLWNDEHAPASRLVIYGSDGTRLGVFDSNRRLDRVAVGRPTNRSAPRIIVTSGDTLLVFNPKKLASGKPLWAGRVSPPAAGAIASLAIVDGDGDGKSGIALTTASGAKVFVDFTGHATHSHSAAHLERLAPRRAVSLE